MPQPINPPPVSLAGGLRWHPAFVHRPKWERRLPCVGVQNAWPILDQSENVASCGIYSALTHQIAGLRHGRLIDLVGLVLANSGLFDFWNILRQRRRECGRFDWFGPPNAGTRGKRR